MNRGEKYGKTLVFYKPDCIERNLVNTIFKEFILENNFKIMELKPVTVTREKIIKHYKNNLLDKFKDIVERVVKFYENKIIIVMILERENAISKMRNTED